MMQLLLLLLVLYSALHPVWGVPKPGVLPRSAAAVKEVEQVQVVSTSTSTVTLSADSVLRKDSLDEEAPYYGYKKLDPTQRVHRNEVADFVKGRPQAVFDLVRDWSRDSIYWNKEIVKWTDHKPASHPNQIGSVRQYFITSREITDQLLHVDMEKRVISYGVLETNPPVLKGAVTHMRFEAVEGQDELTKVTCSVAMQLHTPEEPALLNIIKRAQRVSLLKHIATMKHFFKPDTRPRALKIGQSLEIVGKDFGEVAEKITHRMVTSKPQDRWEYGSYDARLGPLPTYCKVLPFEASIMPMRLGQIFQRVAEYVYSQGPMFGYLGFLGGKFKPSENSKEDMKKNIGSMLQNPFVGPFTGMWLRKPTKLIENLKDPAQEDKELAAQLIRGVNPMKITLAKQATDLPPELRQLKAPDGRTVDQLIASKSLFYCDYWEVAVGDYDEKKGVYSHQAKGIGGIGKIGHMKYWYAPKLAVYKNRDGKLNFLGFTLTRFDDKVNKVYTKSRTPPNEYALAKLHLTCADNQHHQFVSHLGLAHLNMEPFALATHNAFPPGENRHPIGKILHPHFQDTVGIHFLARQTLISRVAPFTDPTFSPGTVNALKIFSRAYEKWDFVKDNFVNHLKARGFDEVQSDDLPGYYYREDGFKVWNALKSHFGRLVDRIYVSDHDVQEDRGLWAWIDEIRDIKRANMPTFPERIDTKSELVDVLTNLVFTCSAQHAAVNFAQLRYVSYVPNRPDSLRLPMVDPEEGETDIQRDVLFEALPSTGNGQFQTLFAYLLTTPPDNPFDQYGIGPEFAVETHDFLADLHRIHLEISERNRQLEAAGEIPYEYLDPHQIPQSINI